MAKIEGHIEVETLGELTLKGFTDLFPPTTSWRCSRIA
jgi:hypothetical protein